MAALVAGCGGDSSLDADGLADSGNELCASAQDDIDDFDPPADLVEFGDTAGRTSEIVAALSTDLLDLEIRGDLVEPLDDLILRFDDIEDELRDAKRAAAVGDVSLSRELWAEANDWGDEESVATDLDLDDCVLDLEGIQPPLDDAVEPPVTDPPVTDPPVTDPPVTDPPVTDPPITEPSVTDSVPEYPFTIFDPTTTLLAPDGYGWFPFVIEDSASFYSSLAKSDFAAELSGVTVGSLGLSGSQDVAMLAREFFWIDDVVGTELATSLDEVYLKGVADSGPLTLGGIDGTYYLEDDGTSGWIGHFGPFSIVLQFAAGVEPTGIGEAYVALNYGS